MAETRPTGEQLRFVSSATGEHILDTYLEAAEKGGRTLPDLLGDIFSTTTGLFRSDVFQFRVNNTTREIEFRAGDFPDNTSGWTPLENGNIFQWRGAYATGTAYEQTDLVSYQGSVYICTTAHTSSTANPSGSFSIMIYAEDIRGPQGIPGPQPQVPASINYLIDGSGTIISPGLKGTISIPFNCTITSWNLVSDQTGSIVIDVQKSSFADFPTSTSITGSAPPTITSAQKASSSTLTGWTTAIAAGDILSFSVSTVASVSRVSVSLSVSRG